MTTQAVRKARIEAIFREDEGKTMRKSHENPQIREAYEQFFKSPLESVLTSSCTEYFGRSGCKLQGEWRSRYSPFTLCFSIGRPLSWT